MIAKYFSFVGYFSIFLKYCSCFCEVTQFYGAKAQPRKLEGIKTRCSYSDKITKKNLKVKKIDRRILQTNLKVNI